MTTRIRGSLRSKRSLFMGVALGLLLAWTGNPAIAADPSRTSPEGVGLQAASWLVTIPSGAGKVAFARGGASSVASPGR